MFIPVKKFWSLSSTGKKAFCEAFVLLGLTRFAILALPFKWLVRSLIQCSEKQPCTRELTAEQRALVITVALSIRRAATYTPWQSVCLPQALTAQKMLQRRGLPGFFCLGVRKDEQCREHLEAHAWSQCGEIILTGGHGVESFTVVSVFSWGSS